MGVGFGIIQVVDGDNLNLFLVVIFIKCLENVVIDLVKIVDCDVNCYYLIFDLGVFCMFVVCNVVNIIIKKEILNDIWVKVVKKECKIMFNLIRLIYD